MQPSVWTWCCESELSVCASVVVVVVCCVRAWRDASGVCACDGRSGRCSRRRAVQTSSSHTSDSQSDLSDAVMSNLIVLKETPLTSYLNVMMRDKNASRAQFVTYSNRLVRLLIEEAMALLPSTPVTIETPCGSYEGCKLPDEDRICAVSILRAADCMLGEVRVMMPSVAAGKILIQRDEERRCQS